MTKKILIVDDEAHIRRLLERTLMDFEDDGVELLIAEDGEEGLAIIEEDQPDLVFLDVMMPKMNGYDVCKTVKDNPNLRNIYIVMLTAKGQEMDKEQGMIVGADVYMTKPFDPDVVVELAEKVLGL